MDQIELSIIIVSYNTKDYLKKCIESLSANIGDVKNELIVIDNASDDGSLKFINSISLDLPLKVISNKKNLGYGPANNQGMRISKGKYVLLLNSDTLIPNSIFREMFEWMEKNSQVGLASCSLLNKNGSLQGTGGYFPTLLRVISWMTIQDLPLVDKVIKPFHPMKADSFNKGDDFYRSEKELDWVTGAFFLIRRKALEDVGYFDEDFFMYTEDVDYCYRLKKKGWKVMYLPKWQIYHFGGASGEAGSSILNEFKGIKLFYKKHYPSWQYFFLRFFLKLGSLGRIILFSVIRGRQSANVYAKAFREA